MTGQCYFCAAGDHDKCFLLSCTCCGEANRAHQENVNRMEVLLRDSLQKGNLGIFDA